MGVRWCCTASWSAGNNS